MQQARALTAAAGSHTVGSAALQANETGASVQLHLIQELRYVQLFPEPIIGPIRDTGVLLAMLALAST